MHNLGPLSMPALVLYLGTGILSANALAASDVAGIPNFHQVSSQLLRGAQPTTEGFQNLAKLGVKTVIDLRAADELAAAEKKVVELAGMRFVNIPMRGMHTPTPEQISQVLALFNDGSAGPVFVHCKRGADRTGTVVACYRISHDRWDNERALLEARSLGMSWLERSMQSFVRKYKPAEAVSASNVPVIVPTPAVAVAP